MPLQNFTIFGERSSGTELLSKLMIQNFDLPYTQQFGSTHFFGFYDFNNIFTEQTLFLSIVREPVDWLNAFYQNPQYVPLENQELSAFLSKPFYSLWTGTNGLARTNGSTDSTITVSTSHNTNLSYFIPDLIHEDLHIHTKQQYNTIFELRKVKTDYLTKEIPKIVKHTVLIRYEDLVENTKLVLETLQGQFKLTHIDTQYKLLPNDPITPLSLDDETKQYILANLDSVQENKLGYCINGTTNCN
jgi:hypothetical protein